MSALTDLFQSMANKIRSKTGTATTYTPPQMVADGIDDVFDAGVASATTPITPSNAIPVSMTANTGYKPTTNGVAIEQIDKNINPSSTPVSISNGEIIKAYGSGVVVDAVPPTPTILTPSNSSPATITSGETYTATANGKAVETVQTITPTYGIEDIVQSGAIIRFGDSGVITKEIPTPSELTPSNSSPATITKNGLYSATGNGYAISSYSSKTPSDTSPASISSGAIIKASSAGYLVKTVSKIGETDDLHYATASATSSGTVDITVTKKPRYIFLMQSSRTTNYYCNMLIVDTTKNKALRTGYSGSSYTEDATSLISTYFPTISSSKVTVNLASFGYNHRLYIVIYY